VEQMLLVGASRWEATQAVVQRSLTAALGPTLSHMGAAGIVTLPSFMSGQLLGGVPPIQVPPLCFACDLSLQVHTSHHVQIDISTNCVILGVRGCRALTYPSLWRATSTSCACWHAVDYLPMCTRSSWQTKLCNMWHGEAAFTGAGQS
jgi:hypothetical protein